MEKREKTVERQILDADLLNTLKDSLGEVGEEFGKKFIEMSGEEQDIVVALLGVKTCFNLDVVEMLAFELALKKLYKASPIDTKMLIRLLLRGFANFVHEKLKETEE